jgi:hypothetical protein
LTQYGLIYGGGAGGAPVAMAACNSLQIVAGGSTAPVCEYPAGDVASFSGGAFTFAAVNTSITSLANLVAVGALATGSIVSGFSGIDATPIGGTTPAAVHATTLSATGALTYGGVTLTNAVTGTGKMVLDTVPSVSSLTVTTAFTATGLVTNADLGGSIVASKLVGTDIATVGTLTSGSAGTGFIIRGVTMTLGSDAIGDVYYRNSSGILTRLAEVDGECIQGSGGLPVYAACAGGGSGTITSIATGPFLTGGTITTTGTIKASFLGGSLASLAGAL